MAPEACQDSSDHRLRPEKIDAKLRIEPTENADANDPAEPIERIDPDEPIDRMEPLEPIDKIEPEEPIDNSEPAGTGERAVDPWSDRMRAILAAMHSGDLVVPSRTPQSQL